MFEQTFIVARKTKRDRAIVTALIAQTVLVTAVGVLPLRRVQALAPMKQFLAIPRVQLIREAVEKPLVQAAPQTKPIFNMNSLKENFRRVAAAEPGPIGIPALLAQGNFVGSIGDSIGVPGAEIRLAPQPKPTPEPKSAQLIRLTSIIAQSQLVYAPKPAYPHLAVVARSEGTVRLQAVISRSGKIENLHVLTGPALLVNAALEAVQTWRYRPLLLNGEAVEVITEIDVVFTLQR